MKPASCCHNDPVGPDKCEVGSSTLPRPIPFESGCLASRYRATRGFVVDRLGPFDPLSLCCRFKIVHEYMLTGRLAAVIAGIATALSGCVRSHYSPVAACPPLADGTHPSNGALEVQPSEVPDVQLDSMRWYVHTGHEGEEFGTWTSVSAVGRIVSTKETSLVGVGVLVEGMRNGAVVHRMIDSSFYDVRPLPWSSQAYMTIARETVRPDRPVRVRAGEKDLSSSPPARWGCPTRARIVRLLAPGAVLRAPRPPEDERPYSDFYAWNPWTFSVDTIMLQPRWPIALLSGPGGDTARTDVIVVRSKLLYRRFEPDGIWADSTRFTVIDVGVPAGERDLAESSMTTREARRDPATPTPTPKPGETILMIGTGRGRYEWRFPTGSPPADLAPIVNAMSRIGDRMAPTARLHRPAP